MAQKSGNKTIVYHNGDVYEGDTDQELPHGNGTYKHHLRPKDFLRSQQLGKPLGEYNGPWENGEKDGEPGTHQYTNGDCYQGPWIQGKRDTSNNQHQSQGQYTYYTKGLREDMLTKYIGHWSENMKHGYGRMTFTNGDTYDGYWFRGKMDTRDESDSTYTFKANGATYTGKCSVYFNPSA